MLLEGEMPVMEDLVQLFCVTTSSAEGHRCKTHFIRTLLAHITETVHKAQSLPLLHGRPGPDLEGLTGGSRVNVPSLFARRDTSPDEGLVRLYDHIMSSSLQEDQAIHPVIQSDLLVFLPSLCKRIVASHSKRDSPCCECWQSLERADGDSLSAAFWRAML